MNMLYILAQATRPLTDADRTSIVINLAVLGVIVIVGFSLIMLFRRKFSEPDTKGHGEVDTGFSLSGLKDMRDRGEITPEEYEKAKAKIIEKLKSGPTKHT